MEESSFLNYKNFIYNDDRFTNDRFRMDRIDLDILSLCQMKYDLEPCTPSMLESHEKGPFQFHSDDSPKINSFVAEDKRISYISNSFGHRSEEFKVLDKDKTNILFSGCSQTFGVGLPIEETWPAIVYKWMKENNKESEFGPYQALSFTGGSIEKIVQNIFKYCHTFGNPDIIYFLAPDIDRQVGYGFIDHPNAEENNEIFFIDHAHLRVIPKEELGSRKISQIMSAEATILRVVNCLRMLEIFCISNKIELIWNTWGPENQLYSMIDFKKFRSDTELSEKMLYILEEKEMLLPKSKYEDRARDLSHDGYAAQRYFANRMYSWYLELYEKK